MSASRDKRQKKLYKKLYCACGCGRRITGKASLYAAPSHGARVRMWRRRSRRARLPGSIEVSLCPVDGTPFARRPANKRYCSTACKRVARKVLREMR